jgi:hypothetical protein
MVPQITSELRTVNVTECRVEQRQRTYTVYRPVPEVHEQTYEYTVCVPHAVTKTVNYTVAKPVYSTAERQYTVMVPHTEMRAAKRAVCKLVPEKGTRTICVDEGHWEDVPACAIECTSMSPAMTDEPLVMQSKSKFQNVGWRHHNAYAAGWGSGFCCPPDCCAPTVCAPQRRWVSKPVTKQIEYTCLRPHLEYVACQVPVTICHPETRTCTVRLCNYAIESRTKEVTCNEMVPERRVGKRQVCTYRTVAEEKTCTYNVQVPHTVAKQIAVPVCKMVPQTITCQVPVPIGNCCN